MGFGWGSPRETDLGVDLNDNIKMDLQEIKLGLGLI